MSLLAVIKVVNLKGGLISLLLCSTLFLNFHHVNAKPANAQSTSSLSTLSSSLIRPSQPIYTARSSSNSGQKVLTSRNQDGSWQASARLPTSSQSGGNERSRYKIRRDGSLSLALQNPKPLKLLHGTNNYKQTTSSLDRIPHDPSKLNWGKRISRVDHNVHESSVSARRNDNARQFSPAELRSFSVVISDVDVTGNYNSAKDNMHVNEEDAYSKAGIASYHLKSNSIHRMNASWKLKPGYANPTSSDLLEFLSYFANGDSRATRSEHRIDSHAAKQQQRPLRKILGQKPTNDDESGQINKYSDDDKDENKQPFLTWQESSRNIPLTITSTEMTVDTKEKESDTESQEESQVIFTTTPSSSEVMTEVISMDGTTNTENETMINSGSSSSSKGLNEPKVVLHELISTLEQLNKNIEREEAENASPSKVAVIEEKSKVNETLTEEEEVEVTTIPEDEEKDKIGALSHSDHETEIDQTSTEKSKNQQQQMRVDVQMSESSTPGKNGREKEGDVFVQNDAAKFNASSNSNNNTATTEHNSSSSTQHNHDDALDGMKKKKRRRSAKSAFFDSTKSANSNDDNNNTASTSATSLEEESTDNDNSRQRMKITDPQQTASDLKKLMSLILKSDGNRHSGVVGGGGGGGDGESGTQVVNIVITPNQDGSSSSTANHPQIKNNPQKIFFLKTPQVKQMLDIALTDPAVSTAAKKIAAALETNPFPNPIPTSHIDHTFNNLPSYIVKPDYNDYNDKIENVMHEIGSSNAMGQKEVDNIPSTPDGFPLTGNGFLNLHHPNLQFHQALHHMVVNGSTPTSINATTKTNIINIFVINFKENNKQETTSVLHSAVNQSPFRINIKPSPRPPHHKPKPPHPFSIRPLLIESVRPTTPNPFASLIDPALLFNNKMGLAAGVEDDENEGVGISSEKNYEPNKHSDTDRYGLSTPDKINIFDLLPGDIGAVTAVQYAPGVAAAETNENHNNSSNKNQTVSHFSTADNYNAYQQGSNNNGNASNMMPVTMPSYGDYFADFLPDRSREPPGSENMKPQENENINDHNILSILTSSRKPSAAAVLAPYSTSSSGSNADEGLLPPSLSHLEWIFKNQPPPKPQISPQTDAFLMKTKGQSGNNEGNTESDAASESMMEPDETINSPIAYQGSTTQELIQYLLQLQNVSRPQSQIDLNSVSENMTIGMNSTFKPQTFANLTIHDILNIGQTADKKHNATSHLLSEGNEKHSVVEYTTKSPAFWKFGNKLPVGAFAVAANTEEALNNRLRKLLTAFGYSALPTLAAGAAATWPYWVPLVATGRKRRRRRNAVPSSAADDKDDGQITEIIKRRAHQFLNNLMTARNNENGTASSLPPILAPSDRQLLSKSTKNSRREGTSGEQKWIKVDVITATTAHPFSATASSSPSSTPSPTLLSFGEMNGHSNLDKNGTSFHSQSHNNSLRPNTKNNRGNNSNIKQKHDAESNISSDSSLLNGHDNQPMQKHDLHVKDAKTVLSAEQQLDVPLLKNFLKNVLHNELGLSNMNKPSPSPFLFAYSSSSSRPANNAQKIRQPPSTAALPFLSAPSLSSSTPFFSSTSTSPPPPPPSSISEAVMLSQVPIFTPTLNKLITKNGHHHYSLKNPQQQQTGGNNKNNVPPRLNTPSFSRPSTSSLPPPSLLLFPEYNNSNNKGEDDSAEEQQAIAGSDKKVISIATFSTPSPTSVYIHNRGDGSTSIVTTTKAPASSASLAHWQNNNNNGPWGSAFGGGVTTATSSTTSSPDNISSSTTSSVTTTFANIAAATLHGHNDDMIHQHHHHHHHHHPSLSSGHPFNDANNHHSSSNVDYFLNHFNQSNKRLQKIKLADSIRASERSYTSAALLPLWFPIFFGNHSQLSSKLKHAIMTKKHSHY